MSDLPLYTLLKQRETEITALAKGGDQRALQVINLYTLHTSCPGDPVAFTLLGCAFADFERLHPATEATDGHV